MPDREKVIKALEYCALSNDCRPCEYWMEFDDTGCQIMKDALALLKEKEAKHEARLLTAEEVQNMQAGTAFGIETYYEHDGRRIPGCTWALRTESLIISFFGTMFPDTVHKIPYNTLEENENTGKQEQHQYRFWSKRPTFEQIKEIPWE